MDPGSAAHHAASAARCAASGERQLVLRHGDMCQPRLPHCALAGTNPPMSDKPKKPQKLRARLPRGLEDRGPAAIAATRQMVEKIREVYERYGFEPVETPAMEFTDALGKFLPDQDRPNEGVFSFQDDDEQWISLRYDLTAPLARYVAREIRNRQPGASLSQLSSRLCIPQREARPRPLPPVHAVRCRHRWFSLAGGRRRDVHDGGGHNGSARRSPWQLRRESE